MNREQRILNHNKRDATRIVSRKPSNSEGNNGDFAVGNTAQGPMLYFKSQNKWNSMKPKVAPSQGFEKETFKGSAEMHTSAIQLINTGRTAGEATNAHVKILGDHFSWLPLTRSSGGHENDLGFSSFRRNYGAAVHHTEGEDSWHDVAEIPILLPYDAKIKNLFGKASLHSAGDAEAGTPTYGQYNPLKYTIETFSMQSGSNFSWNLLGSNGNALGNPPMPDWDIDFNWDTDSPFDYDTYFIRTDIDKPERATTSIDRASTIFHEDAKMYEFPMNHEHVYQKGSLFAMCVTVKKEDGATNAGFLSANFQLNLEYYE